MSADVRYKLRQDAFFVKDGEGVLLRNDRGSLPLAGKGAYALIKHVFAALEGGATLEDVCAGLASERRPSLEALLTRLVKHGFARVVPAVGEVIPEWAIKNHADVLRFLEDHAEAPFARFNTFRRQRLLCQGDPELLRAVLGALVEYGASRITLIVAPGAAGAGLKALADAAMRRDPEISVRILDECPADEPRDCTIVTDPSLLPVRPQVTSDAQSIDLLLQLREDSLIVSPPLGEAGFCRECAVRCWPTSSSSSSSAERVPLAAASIAANQLVYGLFLQLALPELPREPALRSVDLRTLSTAAHRLSPHARCSTHGSRPSARPLATVASCVVRPDLPSGTDDPELIRAQDERARVIGQWCNRVTGPLLSVGENELAQLPLANSACHLIDSEPRSDTLAECRIVCRGFSARETRTQAVLYALEWLAPRLVSEQLNTSGLSLGVGFSEDEAAFRALYHATMKMGVEGCAFMHAERALDTDSRNHYLLELLAEHGAAPIRFRQGVSLTGLWFACATTRDDRVATGAGVSAAAAQLNALLGLGMLTLPLEPTHAAISSCDMTTWADALNASVERRSRSLRLQVLDRVFTEQLSPLHTVTVEVPRADC